MPADAAILVALPAIPVSEAAAALKTSPLFEASS